MLTLASRLACVAGLVCAARADVPIVVTTANGREITGTSAHDDVVIETSFGTATIAWDRIASITFGEPDEIETDDGTKLSGTLDLMFVPIVMGDGREASLPVQTLATVEFRHPFRPRPGIIVDGEAANGATFYVRLPEGWRDDRSWPAIVILHGSNMNARSYVRSIEARWPKLAERYVLIGVDGEPRRDVDGEDGPVCNYSYVNYGGRSRYGRAGERASPDVVAEVITELRRRLPIDRVFVGGHSQGGFLTYSIYMNFPGLIDGAFPISAGLIIQCEPDAYDDEAIIAAQQATPLAVVHATNDGIVDFGSGRHAWEAFEDAGYPLVTLVTDNRAGHAFMALPVERAITWLERMSAREPAPLVALARDAADDGDHRTAWLAADRALGLDPEAALRASAESVKRRVADAALRAADRLGTAADDARWVDRFLEFRAAFRFTEAATAPMRAYADLRASHEAPADELFQAARRDFRAGRPEDAYARYQKIVDELFGSRWYPVARRSLAAR